MLINSRFSNIALWSLIGSYIIYLFFKPHLSVSLNSIIFHLIILVFAVWHGAVRYGVKGIFAFFMISEIVGNAMENLSIQTGFPFGNYYYTSDGSIPFLFQVPLTIGLAYFAMGYLSWIIASILLDEADKKLNRNFHVIATPIVAAFIMAMWDVVLDPTNSTMQHIWIWKDGGGYFGVPFTNYLGWFFTVYVFFQIFALYVKKFGAPTHQANAQYWHQAIILYFLVGFSFVLALFHAGHGEIADASGHLWQEYDIRVTGAITSLYTMTFVSILAVFRLWSKE